MNRPGTRTLAAVAAALAVGAGAGAGVYATAAGGSSAATASPAATSSAQPAASTAKLLSVSRIYEQDGPGVVELTVSSSGDPSGNPFGGGGGSTAQGSGFVYDKAGHIVTNAHVVAGASSVEVRFSNGKTYTATVVGTDASTDLAVLKVDAPASQLHPLALGDSSSVKVGEGVVAIGSPFGLEETITAGIVSALNRQIQSTNGFTIGGAIQTDAAINHGNSGGPLIDLTGTVIGVNSQIESDSGDNAGVGFAIPSNTVKSVVAQVLAGGTVEHAYLGVQIADGAQGAAIESVQSGTPAAKAGLQAGDVVTAVDGHPVADAAALTAAISGHSPGDRVTLTYTRNGSEHTVTVTLGMRPSSS